MGDKANECNTACPLVLNLADRVDQLEEDLRDVDIRVTRTDVILERVDLSINKFTEAVDSMKSAMLGLQSGIENANLNISSVKEDVKQFKAEFKASEDKFKVDYRTIWSNIVSNKLTYVLGGGLFIGLAVGVVEVGKFIFTHIDQIEQILIILFNSKGI
jgi:hypothetical protein